jgi:hypothetical protein
MRRGLSDSQGGAPCSESFPNRGRPALSRVPLPPPILWTHELTRESYPKSLVTKNLWAKYSGSIIYRLADLSVQTLSAIYLYLISEVGGEDTHHPSG